MIKNVEDGAEFTSLIFHEYIPSQQVLYLTFVVKKMKKDIYNGSIGNYRTIFINYDSRFRFEGNGIPVRFSNAYGDSSRMGAFELLNVHATLVKVYLK